MSPLPACLPVSVLLSVHLSICVLQRITQLGLRCVYTYEDLHTDTHMITYVYASVYASVYGVRMMRVYPICAATSILK